MTRWLLSALLLPLAPAEAPPVVSGWLSQYGPQSTAATLAYRQSTGELPEDISHYAGFIATADCDRIGQDAWLSVNGAPWQLVAAFDCVGHSTTADWMRQNNIIAEVSYGLAVQHDFVGRGGILGELRWME